MASRQMLTPDEYLKSLEDVSPPLLEGKPTNETGRWRRRLKLGFILGLVIIVAIVIYIVQFLARLSDKPFSLLPLLTDGANRTNILILGVGDSGHAGEKLSDTNLLVSLNRVDGRVVMISLPRDLRVPIEGYGARKLNQANSLGGPQLAVKAVATALGVPVNYYVISNFNGLKDAVDAVDGVDITVTERLYDSEYPCADNEGKSCGLDIKPGQYHMDGAMALQYARCRKGTCGNDFGRAARQQEILGLLQSKVFTSEVYFNPGRLTALAEALSSNIQTDLSTNQLVQVGLAMKNPKQKVNFVLSTAKGGLLKGDPSGSSDLLPLGGDFDAVRDYVRQLISGQAIPAP